MENESSLDKLKIDYSKLQKKYGLPEFDELNRDFKIEKLSDVETDFLVREVRSFVGESFENFLRFVEALLNPTNVPMFLFPVIKSLGVDEKEKLMEIHKKMARLEVDAIKLINYSEEKEAEFIKKAFKLWQTVKKDFIEVIEVVEKKWDVKTNPSTKNYFG